MDETYKCHPDKRAGILYSHPRYGVVETSGVTMETAQVVKVGGGESAVSQIVLVGDTQRGEVWEWWPQSHLHTEMVYYREHEWPFFKK